MQIHLKDTLAKPLALLQETARTIGTLQLENKIQLDVDEYVDGFKPTLMDIVYKWVNGISFAEISQVRGCFLEHTPPPLL
jgi:ATP-dependent RNA helicase DOB1